jgi:hypothetical protein
MTSKRKKLNTARIYLNALNQLRMPRSTTAREQFKRRIAKARAQVAKFESLTAKVAA